MIKNPDRTRLYVCEKQCKCCLLGKKPIPTPARVEEILNECEINAAPFLCHEHTIVGQYTICRGFYEAKKGEWLLFRMGHALKRVFFRPAPVVTILTDN